MSVQVQEVVVAPCLTLCAHLFYTVHEGVPIFLRRHGSWPIEVSSPTFHSLTSMPHALSHLGSIVHRAFSRQILRCSKRILSISARSRPRASTNRISITLALPTQWMAKRTVVREGQLRKFRPSPGASCTPGPWHTIIRRSLLKKATPVNIARRPPRPLPPPSPPMIT
jgi:hypothetical protein